MAEDVELGSIERWIAERFSGDGDGFETKEKETYTTY